MEYQALLSRDGRFFVIEFPGLQGLVTDTRDAAQVEAVAAEALESWLRAELSSGEAPPRPTSLRAKKNTKVLRVPVPFGVALALDLRWARKAAGLTQAELAKRIGMTQQQLAKIEKPNANPRAKTLASIAQATNATIEIHPSIAGTSTHAGAAAVRK